MPVYIYTGNSYLVDAWVKTFPDTYFGFTGMVDSFTSEQEQALQHVEENRLLLETDAPYFGSPSSPTHLGEVAVLVARCRDVSYEHILELTVANASRLYRGSED